jgi:sigma-B regulation protein RsbU (phosphoserine phosphatase)
MCAHNGPIPIWWIAHLAEDPNASLAAASEVPPAAPAAYGLHALADAFIGRHGRFSRAFENLILGLIIFSIASIGLEAIPNLPGWATGVLRVAEVLVVAVFSFEYLLRLVAAPNKLGFVFSFQGLVDLLAIAPFFVVGVDARWVRALRLLRLLRLLKLQTHILEATVEQRTRELAEKNAALQKAQAQLKAELDFARALQIAILPSSFPNKPGCEGAACMIPATTMGGDFYDFIELPDGKIGLAMADVSGHGVPAAFFMAVARTNLRDLAALHPDPGECLARTNEELCAQNPMELFVSVFYSVLDPPTGLLRYANAGHNPPFVRRASGAVEALTGTPGLVLGAMPGVQFPTHTVQLLPGDRVVMYTDGVTEAFNPVDEAYGTQRLVEAMQTHGKASPGELIAHIRGSVASFAGAAPQSDDMAITVLTWNQP